MGGGRWGGGGGGRLLRPRSLVQHETLFIVPGINLNGLGTCGGELREENIWSSMSWIISCRILSFW